VTTIDDDKAANATRHCSTDGAGSIDAPSQLGNVQPDMHKLNDVADDVRPSPIQQLAMLAS
jgi:hypothetical protein